MIEPQGSDEISRLRSDLRALESQVRLMRDRQEIHDALMRYCRGQDRCDADLVASTIQDYDAVGTAERLRATTKRTMHVIGNMLIDLDGDSASSESYLLSYHILEHEGKEYTRARGARYFHRWQRIASGWITTARAMRDEWSRLDEVIDRVPDGATWHSWARDAWIYGERSKSDLAYTWTPTGTVDRRPSRRSE
jgi:SnoaL-like protein